MLYCPNYTCQTPNSESHKFCQKCRTLLPRHYLWAVGEDATAYRPGDTLVNRYLCKSSRIFLDTKPGLYPTVPTEIPPEYAAYLRLSPYRLHVPQIYDVVPSLTSPTIKVVLLDQAALNGVSYSSNVAESPVSQDVAAPVDLQLLPALIDVWQSATALRQLNWLWQIAHLWQPFSSEQVVSSVLSPELIRVEGPLLRLLELRPDGSETITLAQLGQIWSQWLPSASPEIAKRLTLLCQQLVQGQFRNSEQLVEQLDEMLAEVGRSQARRIQIATRTDQGPSRQRNEDACYPPAGTIKTQTIRANQTSVTPDTNLVIVCDGIGGHQGGDVASNLAIEAVRQQVQVLNPERLDPPSLTVALERAVCVANDLISQRNDSEQRYDRQRMGTTLVMGLVRSHELYITHVGDSRAYWITRRGCRQVTLDDDVASREVRLGYSPYREALQQPSAGSLVQALGMGASSALHPTVQRFILDEDGVFLLCSDGLSDNDRVEEYWETTLLPLLDGKSDVSIVSQQLVEIANTRNGHDNVTVGLLYVQVADLQQKTVAQESQPVGAPTLIQYNQNTALQPNTGLRPAPSADVPIGSDPSTAKTQLVSPRSQVKKPGVLPLLFSIILLLGGGGLLAYSLSLSFRGWVDSLIGLTPAPMPEVGLPVPPSPAPSVASGLGSLESLQSGSFIQLSPVVSSPAPTAPPAPVLLLPQPQTTQPPLAGAGAIPAGSVLKVLRQQASSEQERWVQLQVCSVPTATPGTSPPSFPGASPPSLPPQSFVPSAAPAVALNSVALPIAGVVGLHSPLAIATAPGSPLPPPPPPDPLPPGASGWVQENQILPMAVAKPTLTPEERGTCAESSSPIPSETPAPATPSTTEPSLSYRAEQHDV